MTKDKGTIAFFHFGVVSVKCISFSMISSLRNWERYPAIFSVFEIVSLESQEWWEYTYGIVKREKFQSFNFIKVLITFCIDSQLFLAFL